MTGAADYRLGTVCGLMIDDWELGIGDWDWAGDWDWDCEWGLGIGHLGMGIWDWGIGWGRDGVGDWDCGLGLGIGD